MKTVSWFEISAWRYVDRNAAVYDAARDFLDNAARLPAMPTDAVARAILVASECDDAAKVLEVSRVLLKLAGKKIFMPKYATHDGEAFQRYGRVNTRWQWWGQKG